MFRSLLIVAAVAALAPAKGDPVRAVQAWLNAYHRGKLDLVDLDRFVGKQRRAKDFVSYKFGVIGDGDLQGLNHEKELRLICTALVGQGDAEAVEGLLQVASVGLDGKKYDFDRVPGLVRGIADSALAEVRGDKARQPVREAVADLGSPTSLAALRAIGSWGDERDRPLLEAALRHPDAEVRISAAIGLERAKLATAIPALADQVSREDNPRAAAACLDALAAITRGLEGEHQDELRRATTSANRVLGTLGWQVDEAAVAFLSLVRSADTVPALIGVLQRFAESTDEKVLDRASGVVRRGAHELLLSLTGATFPIDRPDLWEQWWTGVADEFKVAEDKGGAATPAAGVKTTSGTFFGIPVRGSRILFVVDFSGSMDFNSYERAGDGGQLLVKMDVARRELKGAVSKLTPEDQFNLIWFSHKVGSWKPKLVEATDANKKKFASFIDKADAEGGTNVWDGLVEALGIKAGEKRDRYYSHVDEMFVLSDGAPSAGQVIDPAQILAGVRDANASRRVRINTVFVPGPDDEAKMNPRGLPPPFEMKAPELMKRLAEENGGVFIEPGSQ